MPAGLQWSPGVLQKDALSAAAAGATGGAAAGSPSWSGGNGDSAPGSPTTAAAVAATDAEDHPALMTLTEGASGGGTGRAGGAQVENGFAEVAGREWCPARACIACTARLSVMSSHVASAPFATDACSIADGTVRVWVETLVLMESGSPGPPTGQPAGTHPRGRPPSQLHRRSPSPGAGSPGAAPSSPRDARAAAAAAVALGAAAPAITSYFCMALLIDATSTAAGAAAAAAMASPPGSSGKAGLGLPPGGGVTAGARPQVALWARHAGPLLLHKQQRRVAAPVLWLFTATIESRAGGASCRILMHLHAVRGLAAIVMSAGYGGSLSSTSGGSSSTRPAAVLWGHHSWELPTAAAASADLPQLLRRLCCWVSDEEGYPLLHAFTSTATDGAGRLLLAGRTFATVQEEGPMGSLVSGGRASGRCSKRLSRCGSRVLAFLRVVLCRWHAT